MAKYGAVKEVEQDEELVPLDFVPGSLKKQIPTLSEEEKQELYTEPEATNSKELYIQKGQEVVITNESKYIKGSTGEYADTDASISSTISSSDVNTNIDSADKGISSDDNAETDK